MQVLSDTAGLVTNFEVYQATKGSVAARSGEEGSDTSAQAHIEDCTIEHLTEYIDFLTVGKTKEVLQKLEAYKLTRRETLQLVNLCPTRAIEIHLVVEEIEERLSDAQIQEILDLFVAIGAPELRDVAEDEEEEDAMQGDD